MLCAQPLEIIVSNAVVLVGNPESAYRYRMLFEALGMGVKAVDGIAPVLSCIVDRQSVLLVIEDEFNPNTSAHRLIDQIRSMPGRPSQIPIIRVWKRLVLAAAGCNHGMVETLIAPATVQSLAEAMKRLGLIKQLPD